MLYGRDTEQAEIDRLLADARAGHSGALVLRGEAGIGKSALLQYAADRASAASGDGDSDRAGMDAGMRVLRATGVEAETDIPFAGLHQLLWPVHDRIDALPAPQAAALHAALGSGDVGNGSTDRFAIGLAVLTLLADLSEDGPVLCLVDDAQWMDRGTAEALLFAARRLAAERVAMLFAAREEAFTGTGLPELRPPRLARADAGRLLAERGLPPALHDRVVRESAGNPLALIEFGAARQRMPDGDSPLAVPDRVLASFRAQIGRLPERTRLMLLIAAAEGRGYLPSLLGAAQRLGVDLGDLAEAERAGLVKVAGSSITFRHPLIRAAAYQDAATARRLTVHQALAEASDEPTCRVRHLASAAVGPDESVAADLQQVAEAAQERGGLCTAGTLLRRAAELTPEAGPRARRLSEAAAAVLQTGHVEEARELAERAEELTGDPAALARLARVRAAVEFERGDPRTAARLLLEYAAHAAPAEAEGMLRTGAVYAWTSGDTEPVRTAADRLRAIGRHDAVVEGMAHLATGDYTAGVPLLEKLVAEAVGIVPHAASGACTPAVERRIRALHAGLILGADTETLELAAQEAVRRRREGLVGALPDALQVLAQAQVAAGLHREAEATVAEAVALAHDIGMQRRAGRLGAVPARIAAIEGDAQRLRALAADAPGDGSVDSAFALLDLGLGRYEDALRRLEELARGPRRHTAGVLPAAADQVEAAVRAGRPERAREPLERLRAWAEAGDRPWPRAVALRCQGLLEDAEDPYAQAVHLHRTGGGRPFERARTELVYGEWLRRARRRSDARSVLRSALETFESLRAAPWAERTRTELRAAGDTATTVQPTAPDLLDRLTPQERQVVRLAAEGISSREIAAQLFLSPRTVEYHLYKAYPKLGVSSRRELSRLPLEPAAS
ncbi:regulatory protein, luxR family [Thermomonospora echinospora]|uniref:Regulatory protein, luxR family n=1 Tax=Thermomonospora echinospora TaxID=1992 RepID=A0A1H6CMB3_9ACTN|nr:LuxR family transcriptional regulator [Thermomonospora echinospora]SEG74080.1 regulatory protein, luxR family [Thermomonospora echinospora]